MLKSLRWQLTFLYLFAAIGLVSLMGAGTYALIDRYFQQTTDLALEYKMATQFHLMGLVLPAQLGQSEILWLQNNSRLTSIVQPTPAVVNLGDSNDHEESEEAEDEGGNHEAESFHEEDHRYNADLAAVFVISLDESGQPILASNLAPPRLWMFQLLLPAPKTRAMTCVQWIYRARAASAY